MPKRSSKDLNVTAFRTLQAITGGEVAPSNPIPALDNAELRRQIMREMGKRGGQKGGKARAAALTKAERSKIAKMAAKARWSKTTDSG